MSEAEEREDNRSDEQELPTTASFDGLGKEPGSRIGQFRIESELGRGGMGVVYLAHDTKLERAVAIKCLPPEIMDNPKVRSRLKREAKLLASLNHPNIATIHDVIEEESGTGYLVLEYVPGETLGERIGRARQDYWYARLHESGTSPRQADRQAQRHLVIRLCAVRDALRQGALRRPDGFRHAGKCPASRS